MNNPYDTLLVRLDEKILDAERISPNFLRSTVKENELTVVVDQLRKSSFELRWMFAHRIGDQNSPKLEIQYFLSTILNNRDYQWVVCVTLNNLTSDRFFPSISDKFSIAEGYEAQIESEWGIRFIPPRIERSVVFRGPMFPD